MTWSLRTTPVLLTLAASVTFVGCSGGGGGGGGGAAPSSVEASKNIGPSGGTVEVTDATSPIFGTKVTIPAAALSSDLTITIDTVTDSTLPAGGTSIVLGPAGTIFSTPVTIELPYTDAYVANAGLTNEAELLAFVQSESTSEFEVVPIISQDTSANVVVIESLHFSFFTLRSVASWSANNQPAGFIDPQAATSWAKYNDVAPLLNIFTIIQVKNPKVLLTENVGKGNLSTLQDVNKKTVILVHGILANGLTFQYDGVDPNTNDLVDGLSDLYDNIIVFQYPWGNGIVENATLLANEFNKWNIQNADIIAHSMGGRGSMDYRSNTTRGKKRLYTSLAYFLSLGERMERRRVSVEEAVDSGFFKALIDLDTGKTFLLDATKKNGRSP